MLYYVILYQFSRLPNYQNNESLSKSRNSAVHCQKKHVFRTFLQNKTIANFFMIFRYIAKKRPFFEIRMCILQIILFLIFLEFQKQLLLIISIISNPLDWRFSHVTDSYLNYFNYFNSPGYQIIKKNKIIKCFPHTKLEIPDPGILNN